jgi:site-specific DNA-cytosine methylase
MTCAATLAGLKVLYGVDINGDAGQTWQKNFSPAEFLEMSVHDFSVLPGHPEDFIVDVLHLSPPCQMFSPIKTRDGKNDEFNFASLFGVGDAIKKARPRIATLEQTFGIMAMKHTATFIALIRMFTDLHYDVSWDVKTFQRYGLPQSRQRLIIVASWYVFFASFVFHFPLDIKARPLTCRPQSRRISSLPPPLHTLRPCAAVHVHRTRCGTIHHPQLGPLVRPCECA